MFFKKLIVIALMLLFATVAYALDANKLIKRYYSGQQGGALPGVTDNMIGIDGSNLVGIDGSNLIPIS